MYLDVADSALQLLLWHFVTTHMAEGELLLSEMIDMTNLELQAGVNCLSHSNAHNSSL